MYRYAMISWAPALTAGAIATLLSLALVGVVLFTLFPPAIDICSAIRPLDVFAIFEALQDSYASTQYPASFGFGCQLGSISRLFDVAWNLDATRYQLLAAGFAIAYAPIIAFFAAYADTPHKETVTTKSGRAVTFGEYARRKIRSYIRARGKLTDNGLWLLPHVQLNREQEARNILLLGGHGSGKTGWLRGLIEQLLPRPGKTFILDVKGDMVEGLPIDRFILVAAADLRTWTWDLAKDVTNRMRAVEFAAKIIAASEREPMWGDSARAILADLIVYLRSQHRSAWGWTELAEIILSTPVEIKAALVSIKAPSAMLVKFGGDEEENRTVLSILTTLWVAGLTQILPLAQAWAEVPIARRFSLSDWVRRDSKLPHVLVFQKSSEFPELSSAVGAFLIDAIAAFVLSPARRSVGATGYSLVLDEFPELSGGEIKNLPRLLALGREAGVTTIVTLQDLGQLAHAFGERAGMIQARFGIRGVLKLEDGDTTQEVCKTWIQGRELRRERERNVEELKAGRDKAHETVKELVIEPTVIADDLGVFEKDGSLTIRGLVLGFATVAFVDVPMTIWRPQRDAFSPARWLDDDWTA